MTPSFAALHQIWHRMTDCLVSLGKPVACHCQHTVAVVYAGVKALGTACTLSIVGLVFIGSRCVITGGVSREQSGTNMLCTGILGFYLANNNISAPAHRAGSTCSRC